MPDEREKDKCVLCWKETKYYKDTHIDLREHYVEGSGQLCPECHERVYPAPRHVFEIRGSIS